MVAHVRPPCTGKTVEQRHEGDRLAAGDLDPATLDTNRERVADAFFGSDADRIFLCRREGGRCTKLSGDTNLGKC